MNTAQFIAKFLADHGVTDYFALTGGGAMFLNDAFAYESRLSPVYCHHEQACAMAAEAYARISGRPGVVSVTTGPGGINALNGVFGAYTDSIPMLVISGQVKRATHLGATPVTGLRQLGDQEADIIAMAKPVCKRTYTLFDPSQARRVIEEAWRECQSGRPGPVWIDIPIDVQSAAWPETAETAPAHQPVDESPDALQQIVARIVNQLQQAKRPLLLFGSGVRLSATQSQLIAAASVLSIPIATAWTHDTIETAHPLFGGRPGTIGTRWGNFVLQSCDVLLVLGSRLNIRQTSYNFASFAKNAHIIQIDVDEAELRKPIVVPHEGIVADLKRFAPEFLEQACAAVPRSHRTWLDWIHERRAAYPVVTEQQRQVRDDGRINPYYFLETLFDRLPANAIIATGNASACIIPFQIAPIKAETRLFSNSGSASMGYDIPAAVGAAVAAPGKPVFCIAGDGSAQLNIQELQTIKHYQLDVTIVILANDGYLSIRSSQQNFFKRRAGESAASGVTFPDYARLAAAYEIEAVTISGANFGEQLDEALRRTGPKLLHVLLDGEQGFEPRMSSRVEPDGTIVSPSLEDLFPFLSPEQLQQAMDVSAVK